MILIHFNWPEVRENRLQAFGVVEGDSEDLPRMVGRSGEVMELVRLTVFDWLFNRRGGHED